MSALRLPQHLADDAHTDRGESRQKFELLEEIDASVGHTERDAAAALMALRAHDVAGGDPMARQPLLDRAVSAVWRLIVQHEAFDLTDHQELIRRLGIPAEVMSRIGSRN
jgi:hypothetical protein